MFGCSQIKVIYEAFKNEEHYVTLRNFLTGKNYQLVIDRFKTLALEQFPNVDIELEFLSIINYNIFHELNLQCEKSMKFVNSEKFILIASELLLIIKDIWIVEHCHFTKDIKGLAHKRCNQKQELTM